MRKLFFVLGLFLLIFRADFVFAIERIGVISDNIMFEQTPYSAYSRTPDFLVQDIIDTLNKNRSIQAIPVSQVRAALLKSNLSPRDLAQLRDVQSGYSLDFVFLKKVAQAIGASKIVVVTSNIDIQRDFLKPTLWNALNVPGVDAINPTQKITVYAVFVDVNRETVLWEDIFAKNIRNNKMKNLDTTVAGNYEGLMRIKQYSKYISPEISNAVVARVAPRSLSPKDHGSKLEYVVMGVNHKMRIGSQKNLSNIDYIADGFDVLDIKVAETKENIGRKTAEIKEGINNNKTEIKEKWAQKREESRAKSAQRKEEARVRSAQKAQEKEKEKAIKALREEQKLLNVNDVTPVNLKNKATPAKLKDKKNNAEPVWFVY